MHTWQRPTFMFDGVTAPDKARPVAGLLEIVRERLIRGAKEFEAKFKALLLLEHEADINPEFVELLHALLERANRGIDKALDFLPELLVDTFIHVNTTVCMCAISPEATLRQCCSQSPVTSFAVMRAFMRAELTNSYRMSNFSRSAGSG